MYTFNVCFFFWENLLRFSLFRLSTSLLFLISFCGVQKLYMMEDDLYLVPFSSSKGLFVTLQLPLPLGLLEECQKHVFHVVLPISAKVLKHFHGMKTDHTNKIQWLVESLILNQELFRWIYYFFLVRPIYGYLPVLTSEQNRFNTFYQAYYLVWNNNYSQCLFKTQIFTGITWVVFTPSQNLYSHGTSLILILLHF